MHYPEIYVLMKNLKRNSQEIECFQAWNEANTGVRAQADRRGLAAYL